MRALAATAAVVVSGLAPVPADVAFEPWFTSRGVAVEIARQPSGPPWIRSRAEIPAPAERVARVLGDFARYRELLAPAVKTADVLEQSGSAARLHLVWPYPFPFSNRDAVVLYETYALEGGGTRIAWRSDARPGDPQTGVRIARVAGETRIEPASAGACRVTYAYLGDLGGRFPRSAEEKAWRAEPVEYMRAIRRAVGLPDLPSDGGRK